MEKIQIEYTHQNSVLRIILNDGKGNVLDSIMMNELHEIFDSIKSNNNLKLITFEGSGKHFSFGASVAEHTKDKAPEMLKNFHRLFIDIKNLGIPTAAKISGQCLGGGLELALICNFIFADETAKLSQPEIVLGVFAPVASVILPMKIGSSFTDDFLLTGKVITASEAKSIGLVNYIYENKEIMNASVDEWIEKNIIPKSSISLRFALKASRATFNDILTNKLLELEKIYLDELMNTNDANEGINSFIDKRQPNWTNC